MSDLIPEGDYKARAVRSYCATSNTKGTPYLNLTFRLLEGDLAGTEVDAQLYVTPKTEAGFVKDLRTLGYRGHNPDELDQLDEVAIVDFLPNDVSIKVQHEEFNGQPRVRVRWINPFVKRAAGGGLFGSMKAAFLNHPPDPGSAPATRPGPIDRSKRPAPAPQPEPEEDSVPFLGLP